MENSIYAKGTDFKNHKNMVIVQTAKLIMDCDKNYHELAEEIKFLLEFLDKENHLRNPS